MCTDERVPAGWRLRHLPSVDSTNRVAAEAARAGDPGHLAVVADHQTAGRGRLGRSWEERPGDGLLVSLLVPPGGLPPDRWHLLTSAACLSAADACASVAGVAPEIKWPNDLLVGDAKLAGVLAEAVPGAVVIGIGLNVSDAPPGAASVAGAAGRPVDRWELLRALLQGWSDREGRWDEVAAEHARRCATVGRQVRAEVAGRGAIEGRAVGVDPAGRLVIDVGGRQEHLSAGDVTHLRPGRPSPGPR